jgi:peroxiredoxin
MNTDKSSIHRPTNNIFNVLHTSALICVNLRFQNILFLAFLVLAVGCGKGPRGTQPVIKIGEPAPSFTLELLDGRAVTLDTFKGKPLVLITMASWCPCSHESAPVFKEVYGIYHPKGVEFLMLGIQDSKRKFEKFVKKKEFPFPAGFDKGDRIAKTYGVSAPPTTFFIDSEGKVVSAFYGKIIEKEMLSAWIDEIVPPPSFSSPIRGED